MTIAVMRGKHAATSVIGLVDSGADSTLFPKTVAFDLGMDEAELTATPHGSGGAGGTSFPTWTTTEQLTGQILAFFPAGIQPWGPVITFQPKFAENTDALFGRADFFSYFSVAFEQGPTLGTVFHLDY